MASTRRLIISLCLLALIASTPVFARTISKAEAENAVNGWLNTDEVPMGASIGWQIDWTDAYNDANGVCAYYIVYLQPAGFVIVAADDLVEPIIGFVTGYAYYDPSPDNVLGAIVSRDLPARINTAENLERKMNLTSRREHFTKREIFSRISSVRARAKWRLLQSATLTPPSQALSVSDVRVPPLLGSTWGQDNVYGNYCYNYYTPNHYYDGCVATAMAQFMRFWQWPTAGIGAQPFSIGVGATATTATTRGGDGLGGPYNWSQMPLTPDSSLTNTQRQAIGALCYDAGVAAHMHYGSGGSGAYMHDAKNALVNTFKYSNAVMGGNEYSDIGANLNSMINPSLDAGDPVLLAIYQYSNGQYGGGHAIVADGYGYNAATLYHHLNLGWDGIADAWYNLPTVDTGYYTFNIVVACIYNIYTSGSGEIISGRITNSNGAPFPGATVTAAGAGVTYTAVSNSNGIYALTHVLPNTTYTITATAPDCTFDSNQTVTTGRSLDGQLSSGNRGGIDFVTGSDLPAAPSAPASIDYPAASATGKYTINWAASDGATAYELMRSADGGASWQQVYADANTAYSESIGTGSYRYWVRAMNGGGTSDWTAGTGDCVVTTTPPAAPASISYPASSTTGKYTVNWAAAGGATSYVLRRSSNNGSTWTQIYAGATASYSESIGSGNYRYSVKAVNGLGSSAFKVGTTTCAVRIPPLAPASISYPASSVTGKYTVSWAASSGATSYVLRRSINGGAWAQIYAGTARSCSQTVGNGNYRYNVKAVSANGSSDWRTGTATCAVLLPPGAPVSVAYPASSTTGIYTITWPAVSSATSYIVRRSANNGATWVQIYSGASPSCNENVISGKYRYSVKAVNNSGISGWRTGTPQCAVTRIIGG
jgi:hypothetical protein